MLFLREQVCLTAVAVLGHRRVQALLCHLCYVYCANLQHGGCPASARSKGGTDVILYASKYDGEPECKCTINVCGRFVLARGITERFGADIYSRLKKEGAISMPHPNNDGPDWLLTDEVRLVFQSCRQH